MKTSEQVAADIVYLNGGDGPHALKNIVAAIEADRAQRDAEPRLTAVEVGALRRAALRWQRRAYLEGVAEAVDGDDRRVEKAQRLVQEAKRTFYELVDRIAAIEADRAQRISDDDIQILADAADYWAAELIDYIIPDADKSERPEWQEQVDSIQAALARYLALKGE